MTVSPPVTRQTEARAQAGDDAVEPRCTVCDHDLGAHDAIGLRYCQATQAQALPRNCICREP